MKNLIFILFTLLITTNISAQKISADNVPAAVTDAFKAKFSNAMKTSWEIDYDNYQAGFEAGKASFSASFDKDGKWLKTESYIKSADLPKVVKDFLTKNFNGYKVDAPEKVETPGKSSSVSVDYEMELTKDDLTYQVSVSDKGIMLKHELKKEDNKGDTK
jgi:hypothetical protein